MAITLPDVRSAYGQRPSTRSTRIDEPSQAGIMEAEALHKATIEFNNIVAEREAKENALNYSLARNEMQRASIEEQEKLVDDPDWQTYGERYDDGLKTRFEEIAEKYDLSPNDRLILDSEGRLIAARGRVTVAGAAREREVSWAKSQLDAGLAEDREAFMLAKSNDESNAILQGSLDAINSAEGKLYLSPEEAEIKRQATAQDYAKGRLDLMNDREEEAALETSLLYRRGYGSRFGEYSSTIREASATHGVPVGLIVAQAEMESSWDPEAKSGARGDPTGLMQLSRGAAQDVGVTDRTDPHQSIMGGAEYDAMMLERFQGDKAKALAAYNWGASNVLEAWDKHGEDWLLHAPEETRNYVKKLLPHWEGTAPLPKAMLRTDVGDGPITMEEIIAGQGSGSVADFLPADVVAQMLEIAREKNKEDRTREEAFAAVDLAKQMFAGDTQEAQDARMRYIAQNTSGAVRDKAETEMRQVWNDMVNAKNTRSTELYERHWAMIQEATPDEPYGYNQIPPEDLENMLPVHRQALEDAWKMGVRGQQWAEVTQYHDPDDGTMSMEEWNSMNPFGPGGKTDQNLDTPLFRNAFTEEDYNNLVAEQIALRKIENADLQVPNVGSYVDDAFAAMDLSKTTDDTAEADEFTAGMKARLEQRLQNAVFKEMNSGQIPRELKPHEIRQLAGELIMQEGRVQETTFGMDWLDWDAKKKVYRMTAAELRSAYLPLETAKIRPYPTRPGEEPMTMYDYLVQTFKDVNPENTMVDDERIARAWFALEADLGRTEVERRLKGE